MDDFSTLIPNSAPPNSRIRTLPPALLFLSTDGHWISNGFALLSPSFLLHEDTQCETVLVRYLMFLADIFVAVLPGSSAILGSFLRIMAYRLGGGGLVCREVQTHYLCPLGMEHVALGQGVGYLSFSLF